MIHNENHNTQSHNMKNLKTFTYLFLSILCLLALLWFLLNISRIYDTNKMSAFMRITIMPLYAYYSFVFFRKFMKSRESNEEL